VGRFYRRQGAYLALFYALAAIDFHHENLIAQGEYPIPIDLEALFHPLGLEGDRKGADVSANLLLYNSVFGVALLPGRIWSNPESEGVDISGLGAMPGQLMPFAGPAWEAEGTDQMRLIRKRHPLPEAQNRPTLQGEAVGTLEYADDLIAGFREMYQFIQNNRRELLSDAGPLARFENDEVRVVVRATRSYADLLRESFHPDVLRDALDRDRLFDRLWSGAEDSSNMAKLIPAEHDDLWNGDVPIFTTRPNSRDLCTSTGKRIGGVLEQSGMVRAYRCIETMGPDDLAQQLWFIRASLATLAPADSRPEAPVYVIGQTPPRADRAQFLSAARAIGDRLEELAVRGDDDDVSWIGLGFVRERSWALVPLGVDFYDGLPGVAFFLGYLGAVTGEVRYTQLARGALRTVCNGVRRRPEIMPSIGAFCGWGGLIFAGMHLATLWGDAELLTEVHGYVERLPELIDKDEGLDIIDGGAGCLLALLGLESCLGSQTALAAAVRAGDRLLLTAQAVDKGLTWPTRVPSKAPLTGMSHGTAGIAWALVGLAARTGERRFAEAALRGLEYERSLFSVERKRWPDLRKFEDDTAGDRGLNGMTAWCHGAAGIGLSRLAILRALMQPGARQASLLHDGLLREEIKAALHTTCAEGFGWNHTLCHGDLGNLDLLVLAGRILDDSYWRSEGERVASGILDRAQHHGWTCANPADIESPGLMTGLAGIGYGLLRQAEPDRLPSILTLEGPRPMAP
jgi:type 2 lantibiotic biosynthesis protein LanM